MSNEVPGKDRSLPGGKVRVPLTQTCGTCKAHPCRCKGGR